MPSKTCQICPVRLYTTEGCPENCSKSWHIWEGDVVKREEELTRRPRVEKSGKEVKGKVVKW
jgi:hypothetical protein